MIDIDHLTVRISGRIILRDISIQVDPGQVVYVLGRNGAGKSTLLRSVTGAARPTTGTVHIDGQRHARMAAPMRTLGTHLGTASVDAAAGLTVRRYLRAVSCAGGSGGKRVSTVLAHVGLATRADAVIGGLSLGMRQRVAIAEALLGDAPNLVFDEPLNGLDIDGIRWFRDLLARLTARGCAILIATHQFDEVVRTGDRVIILDHGAKVADSPITELVEGSGDLESAFLARTSAGISETFPGAKSPTESGSHRAGGEVA